MELGAVARRVVRRRLLFSDSLVFPAAARSCKGVIHCAAPNSSSASAALSSAISAWISCTSSCTCAARESRLGQAQRASQCEPVRETRKGGKADAQGILLGDRGGKVQLGLEGRQAAHLISLERLQEGLTSATVLVEQRERVGFILKEDKRTTRSAPRGGPCRLTARILSLSHPSTRSTTLLKSSLAHLSPSCAMSKRASSLSSTRPPNPIWSACASSGCDGGRIASLAHVERAFAAGAGASAAAAAAGVGASAVAAARGSEGGRGVGEPERKDDRAESSSAWRARRVSSRRV